MSVLVGCYNAAPYLAEAIESILSQSYRPLELVVVDDGSTDGSAEVAERFADAAVVVVRQANRGEGASRNTAVSHARGEILAFMDADDRSLPGRLELQWATLVADPDLDAVFGHAREFVSPELTIEQKARLRARPAAPFFSVSVMAVRRIAFDRVGPFSETLRIGANFDWCARALDLGIRTRMLDEVLVERRLHATNLTRLAKDARSQYLDIVKASLQRRRAQQQVADH